MSGNNKNKISIHELEVIDKKKLIKITVAFVKANIKKLVAFCSAITSSDKSKPFQFYF